MWAPSHIPVIKLRMASTSDLREFSLQGYFDDNLNVSNDHF